MSRLLNPFILVLSVILGGAYAYLAWRLAASLGAAAGFDLQLSGHTHAGQFFPWTLAVRLVHAPHVAGLSRERQPSLAA